MHLGRVLGFFKYNWKEVVNPIGSGDAMMAGIVYRVSRNHPLLEALRFDMVCAGANVLTECAGEVKLQEVDALFSSIQLEST